MAGELYGVCLGNSTNERFCLLAKFPENSLCSKGSTFNISLQ